MFRLLVSAVVILVLVSIYFFYSAVVAPLTIAEERPAQWSERANEEYRPPVLSQTAEMYLADVDWIQADQLETFETENEELVLFTQRTERVFVDGQSDGNDKNGRTLQMTPIAILWKDLRRPDAPPFRLIADKALVQFENRFFDEAVDLGSSSPGRIVRASLEGAVHIDGPDGLMIEGRQFILSEQNLQLYSDSPVRFHYGPTKVDSTEVSGSAGLMAIELAPATEPVLGEDLPRVGRPNNLTLRKDVSVKVSYQQHGKQNRAFLTCAGDFQYDFNKRVASMENAVHVTQFTPKGDRQLKQEMTSDRLEIELEPKPNAVESPDDETSHFLDQLVLRRIKAFSVTQAFGRGRSNVQLNSELHQLNAVMSQLVYDVIARTAVLRDESEVVVTRADTTFACPRMKIIHSLENDLDRLECAGAGRLQVSGEHFSNAPAEATWTKSLEVLPDPKSETLALHIVELTGDAELIVPRMESDRRNGFGGVGLASDRMKVWIDLEQSQGLEGVEDILKKPLAISRAQAIGNVRLVSNQAIVERSNLIDVKIELPAPAISNAAHGLPNEQTTEIIPVQAQQSTRQPSTQLPARVSADEILISLVHDQSAGELVLKKLDGQGNVIFKHSPRSSEALQRIGGDNPVELKGVRVVAVSGSDGDQTVTLLGRLDDRGEVVEPAMMSFGQTRIGGANLEFDRGSNTISIHGPGKFQLPISRDLEGNELKSQATMEISWKEKMVFDGKTARFFKSVLCSLDDHHENISRLNCEDLKVTLNQQLEFQEQSRDSTQKIEISHITANHLVHLEAYEYRGTELIGVRKGDLTRIEFNQRTGEFMGVGNGEFHIWSLGNSMNLSPDDQAAANTPLKSDQKQSWRYSTISFSGTIQGNLEQKIAHLNNQRIEMLTAPVDQALVLFRRDQISSDTKAAENAVWIGSRNLRVLQQEFGGRVYWNIFARESTELEGKIFRAVADELSFDERLGKFMLRGIGKKARIYYQKTPGEPYRSSEAQLIEFVPRKGNVTIDGGSGLSR